MSDPGNHSDAAKDADNPQPPKGDKGETGLGTDAGIAKAGDENILREMPDHRGTPKYPDVEDPDDTRPDIAPQEGHIEENPKTVRDASPGAKD